MSELWKKYMLIALLGFDCIFVPWLCGFMWFGQKINEYNDYDIKYTDAIVVLTGGRNRIAKAVSLINDNMAEHLFISGVEKHTSLSAIANKLNISIKNPDKVELGYNATNTIENAREVKEWIEKNNISSVRLITSNYHIPRSLAELKAYRLPLKIEVTPVYSEKVANYWWQSWGTFRLIFGEYNKYLVVVFRNLFK
ncbi:MAG: YdcF family protein [Alphaproteobacteria bacterium]|nr:YdcF family protein [Alphaproteobacteria bacterium]